jgi:hypothetical protein
MIGTEMVQWRRILLSDRPSQVISTRAAIEIVFDGWLAERPVLIIAKVSRRALSVDVRDAFTHGRVSRERLSAMRELLGTTM